MPTIRATTNKHSLSAGLVMAWQCFYRDALNTYRPELHYMRGPGPKWHAKHATPASAPARACEAALSCDNVNRPGGLTRHGPM